MFVAGMIEICSVSFSEQRLLFPRNYMGRSRKQRGSAVMASNVAFSYENMKLGLAALLGYVIHGALSKSACI